MKKVTVRVTLDAETAQALKELALKDDPQYPRNLPNLLAWLGKQAVFTDTINPMVPLAQIAESMHGTAERWRA